MEQHLHLAERALHDGAQVILFPELSMTGYSVRDLNSELALDVDDSFFAPVKELSKRISIALGTILKDGAGGIHNAIVYFEDGAIKHVHYKVYLPTYGIFEEQRYFSPGRRVKAFDTKFGKIGMLICEDLWHVSLPYILAVQGAWLILSSAASPTRLSGNEGGHAGQLLNSEQHRSLARLLSIYIAFSHRVGFEDGVNFWGASEIVSPNGEVVATAKLFDEDLISCKIDPSECTRSRLFARHFLDEDPGLVVSHLKELGY